MKLLSSLIAILLLSGCLTEAEIQREQKYNLREWRETPEGVRYFTTCIDNYTYIATKTTHGHIALAMSLQYC